MWDQLDEFMIRGLCYGVGGVLKLRSGNFWVSFQLGFSYRKARWGRSTVYISISIPK